MQNNILDKLKIKNTPKIEKTMEYIIPQVQQNININTTIVDKTSDSDINIEDYIEIINKKKRVKKRKHDTIIGVEPIKDDKVSDKPETQITKNEKSKLDVTSQQGKITKHTKIKKLNRKIILTSKNDPKGKPKQKIKSPIGVIQTGPVSSIKIGSDYIENRLSKKEKPPQIKASSYYLNNRQIFINFINGIFNKYKTEIRKNKKQSSCEADGDADFSLMTHQKIVRDYISLYTPYRGLLLYHGLGSGKTCSSIAIAEGIKTTKRIVVMTPASLRMNYIEELKNCGDDLYKKNQFWEFISIDNLENSNSDINTLSNILSLSVEFISKQKGIWLMNVKKTSNFDTLSSSDKNSLDIQLNEMIKYKYTFYNYNGLRMSNLKVITKNYTINPFDNCVVIIDESHNFISRIVNKLGRNDSLSVKLYEYLMTAVNTKIVLLTGTPIINKPNEIAIMFNILRGKIKTWTFNLNIQDKSKINKAFFEKVFSSKTIGGNILDYIEYKSSGPTLTITRNPFGFVNKVQKDDYKGVHLGIGDRGELSDEEFISRIRGLLIKKKIKITDYKLDSFTALPDKFAEFKSYFIDEQNNDVKNMNMFKKRILGLTSYFRDMESLMPRYNKSKDLHVIEVEMSDFQFAIYEEARVQERKRESQNAKRNKKKIPGVYEETTSTYRIFSRAFCNFVFPRPSIMRPLPGNADDLETAILDDENNEDNLDATSITERRDNVDGTYELDELTQLDNDSYEKRIETALNELNKNKEKFLSYEGLKTYSPKFLNIIENISNEKHRGSHLIYTQFRKLEGIGILKLALEANGYSQFKIKNVSNTWKLDMSADDIGKPTFALYTGTETPEEKEIIRNVFNGNWGFLPAQLAIELNKNASNNLYGNIIKVLMITAAGAEGISLKNVRYVHVTEPYWHPVRIEQVIGRARRICSHNELPKELQDVKVFLYLMKFTEKQIQSDDSIELRLKDKSKLNSKNILTSDQTLYEISDMKLELTNKILTAVKEASIDCVIHSDDSESLKCFSFGTVDSKQYSYAPSIKDEDNDKIAQQNQKNITWRAIPVTLENGITYAYNKNTGKVYDMKSYEENNLILTGTLEIKKINNKDVYTYIPLVNE
tara:strand:+ start:13081 stop:16407 length:3327 start_codon:yes stop_codon:yes gene_type:complete